MTATETKRMYILRYLAAATVVSPFANAFLPQSGWNNNLQARNDQPRSQKLHCAILTNEKVHYHDKDFGTYNGCACLEELDSFIRSCGPLSNALAHGIHKYTLEKDLAGCINRSIHKLSSCSPAPSHRKRSPAEIARSEHLCEFGLSKCGIYSSYSPSSGTVPPYECVDTKSSLESCGGCVIPYTLGLTKSEIEELKTGVCTALKGVSAVGCYKGQCVVHKCQKGYEASPGSEDNDKATLECVPIKVADGEGELRQQVGGTFVWKKDV